MAAKTKEVWAENPEGSAGVLPRRISSPLKDVNIDIGVPNRLAAPGKRMVKSASWSDFAGPAVSKVTVEVAAAAAAAGAAREDKKAVEAPANTKAATKEAPANTKAATEVAPANTKAATEVAPANTKAATEEAPANSKAAKAAARANKKAIKKANKAAALAEAAAAAAEKPRFTVPSEDYFNLWKNPDDREEIRASFTRLAEFLS